MRLLMPSAKSWLRQTLLLSLALLLSACGGGGSSSGSPAAATTFSISGAISGLGAAGVTISLTGTSTAQTNTGADGSYNFTGLTNGSYTATPQLTGYVFNPAHATITISNAGVTNINFTQSALLTATGTVTGAPAGVVLSLSGGATAVTTTTSATGGYSFNGLAIGNYTVTPSLAGYTFSPANATFFVGGNVGILNFTATLNTPTYYTYYSDNTAIYALDRSHANSSPVKVVPLVTPIASNSALQSISIKRIDSGGANQRFDLLYIDNNRLYRLPGSSVGTPVPVQISNLTNMTWSCGKPTPIITGLSDSTTQLAFNLPTEAGGCNDSTAYVVNMAMTAASPPLTETTIEANAIPVLSSSGVVGYVSVVNNQLIQTDTNHSNPFVIRNNVTAVAKNSYAVDQSMSTYSPDTFLNISTTAAPSTLYHYDPVGRTLGSPLGQYINLQTQQGGMIFAFAENSTATSASLVEVAVNGQQQPVSLPCAPYSFASNHHLYAGTVATDGLVVVADSSIYRLTNPATTCTRTLLSSTMLTNSLSFASNERFVFTENVGGILSVRDVDLISSAGDIVRTPALLTGFNFAGEANPAPWNQVITHALILVNVNNLPTYNFQELDYKTGNSIVLGSAQNVASGSYPAYFDSFDESGSINGAAIVPILSGSNAPFYQLYTYTSGSVGSLQWVLQAPTLYWLNMYNHNLR